jgi:prepilin-type N-terminal cleavage/methylation domain-containing protein
MKRLKSGFTLVELLMVIAVIGVMAGFGFSKYPGVQKSSRDTNRRSDLKQYQTSLENYANIKGGFYPSRNSETPISTLCSDLGISNCPSDPHDGDPDCNGVCNYYYTSNGSCAAGAACASRYVLYARLEKNNHENLFVVYCSNGESKDVVVNSNAYFAGGYCTSGESPI